MPRRSRQNPNPVGISNRETPAEEAKERKEFPPLGSPAEDAGGSIGTSSAKKVDGAFGKEPGNPASKDRQD